MNAKVKWTAAECLKVINDAANESRHRGEYERANSLVNARARLASILREREQNAGEAVSMPDDAVYRIARALAEWDGVDDPHQLIWEGSPPEPWGDVWMKYEEQAEAIYKAMLASAPPRPLAIAGVTAMSEIKPEVREALVKAFGEEIPYWKPHEALIHDALVELTERNSQLTSELHDLHTTTSYAFRDLTARAEKAEAERDALREDAERYRWLRDRAVIFERDDWTSVYCVMAIGEHGGDTEPCYGPSLDSAVDGCMRDEKARIVPEQEGSS